MRAAFSTVLHKPIYTFRFDRFAGADRVGRLAATLLKSRAGRGVVITTPTDIKSFLLKYVETDVNPSYYIPLYTP